MNDFSPDPAPAIWLCDSAAEMAGAPGWMTALEHSRLNKLTGGRRNEFLASRWLIRRALASSSGHPAGQCRPTDGHATDSAEPSGWQLSISHSQGLAGCAISRDGAIGLDLEPLSRRPQWQRIAARWFSDDEQAWLCAANDPEAFLRVWTLKEAWVKATGRGIADNLQTLNVSKDFELRGDQPGKYWQASLGHVDGCLVAVVYQGSQSPDGHLIPGPIDFSDPDSPVPDSLSIDWILHRQIGLHLTKPEETE